MLSISANMYSAVTSYLPMGLCSPNCSHANSQ